MRPFCMQTNVVCPALPLIARCSQEENVKQYECVLSRKRSIQKVMSFPLIISSSEGVGCLEWNKPAHLHFCQHEYFFHDTDNSLCVYCIWSYKVVFFTAVLHQRYTFSTLSRCEKYEPQRRSQGQTALKADNTWWQNRLQCGRVLQGLQRFGIQLWNTSQTEPFPSASWSTSAWHKVRSLFNFSQSPFIYHATYQIHRYNWLTGCFFFLYWMISLSVPVRSTEELGLFLISFQIYFCIWKKSTSVRMNMKSMLSSPENDSIGCLFKLKRAMFMLRTMAQQEVWCCYSEIWLSLWRSGWTVQNVMTHKTEICIIYSMVSINNNH